jgi:hypothetical protein
MSLDNPIYGVRIHDRLTEDDPSLATLMQSFATAEGPWHDMVTGDPDYVYDVLYALEERRERNRNTMRTAVLDLGDEQLLVETYSRGEVHIACRRSPSDTWDAGHWAFFCDEVDLDDVA